MFLYVIILAAKFIDKKLKLCAAKFIDKKLKHATYEYNIEPLRHILSLVTVACGVFTGGGLTSHCTTRSYFLACPL
jgi:hypothetical protein